MIENLQSYLENVVEEKRFWCNDGVVLSNLEELNSALKKMSDETFAFHVNADKNDFVSWVYDVIGDVKLAQNLSSCNDKKEMAKKIRARITYVKKKISSS